MGTSKWFGSWVHCYTGGSHSAGFCYRWYVNRSDGHLRHTHMLYRGAVRCWPVLPWDRNRYKQRHRSYLGHGTRLPNKQGPSGGNHYWVDSPCRSPRRRNRLSHLQSWYQLGLENSSPCKLMILLSPSHSSDIYFLLGRSSRTSDQSCASTICRRESSFLCFQGPKRRST